MKPRTVNGRWEVTLPDHIADHPFLDDHERERFDSMAELLNFGDVLFDIGAEHGCCSAVYAQMVGGANMVLFEPTFELWRNIRLTWEANNLPDPKGCWVGFLTDTTPGPPRVLRTWPHCAAGRGEVGPMPYRQLGTDVGISTTVDAWVIASGIVPTALTIDVEGCELKVLQGAKRTLTNHRPLVWLSVHSDEMLAAQGAERTQVFDLLDSLGYTTERLGIDHEEHYLCRP